VVASDLLARLDAILAKLAALRAAEREEPLDEAE
jgi:hypothetical protein